MAFQSDNEVIESWLHGRSPHTVQSYRRHLARFFEVVNKPLKAIELTDLQRYRDSLYGAPNSQKLAINAIRSLFTFAFKEGYIDRSPASSRSFAPPKTELRLAERMLSEDEVQRIVDNVRRQRDRVLVRMMYLTGGRVSELCDLKWGDIRKSKNGGRVTVTGKGMKTRAIVLSQSTMDLLGTIRGDAKPSHPVFRSQKGGHLDPSQAWRIVRAAAAKAGIDKNVSPHWFRHSHASHALEKGVSPALVRDTLGHSNLSVTDRYVHSNPNDSSSLYLG